MKDIRNIIGILLGNTIYALGVTMFILPNKLQVEQQGWRC